MSANNDIHVMVVDDEQYICDIIVESLTPEKFDIAAFSEPQKALEHLNTHPVDLVLTDLVMGESSGIDILESTLAVHKDAVVILMTAHPTVQTAISVLKKGAYDFLVKPFRLELLKATIKRGLQHQKLSRENLTLIGQVEFLKAAGAFTMGVDIDRYLRMVLSSCKTELGATAAALIEVEPSKMEIVRWVTEADDPSLEETLLDDSHLLRFAYSKSPQPHVSDEEVNQDGKAVTRTFISCPIFIRRTLHGVINLIIEGRFNRVFPAQLSALTLLTNSAAGAIANQKLYQDLQKSYLQAIRALANSIEARDQYTAGHTDRVIKLAEPVAAAMGWDSSRMHGLTMGCTLHDIGKIGVPDSILTKPGKLTADERVQMMSHPQVGLKIVSSIDLLKPAVPYILSHHERYDGTGYPGGLKGEDIPIEGRLLAVVDTFDAIMSDRPYRRGANISIAIGELARNKGLQFDPQVVDVFLELLKNGKIPLRELYDREEDLNWLEIDLIQTASV
jgi:response regulator RpfG family c-di-GMP phosphodiesterase